MQARMGEWVARCRGEGHQEEVQCDLNGQEKRMKNEGACVFRAKSLSLACQTHRHLYQLLRHQGPCSGHSASAWDSCRLMQNEIQD